MSNSIKYKDLVLKTGDTIVVDYKIKEANNKERIQKFEGILIKIRGSDEQTYMITVRKTSKSDIGIERIFPLNSPHIANITISKKSKFQKAKAYFIRELSLKNTRQKLYKAE